MAEIINGVPIGDLPGIESVPDDSMLVVEFLGKAYHMPGAVLRQMIQDVLDSMGDSVDDVTEARLTAAIETVLASGKYNGVSPLVEVLDEEDGTSVIHIIDAFGVKKYPVEVKGARNAVQYVEQELTDEQKAQARKNIGVGDGTGTADAVQYVPQTLTTEQKTQARNNIGISDYVSRITFIENPNPDFTSQHIIMVWNFNGSDDEYGRVDFNLPYSTYELAQKQGYIKDETTFYKEMSSNLGNPKADSLKIDSDTGTLMLLSAGEPIGEAVTLPTGNADDCKIFIADLNTSTYEDIKAADDAGKICYALWGGYTACMLTTLSPESAIFTTLLDPHLGLYVKFTKGTVGVSDFGLTESHSVLYEPQSLTDAQKAQARENIGALSADDIDVDSIGSNVFVGKYDTITYAEIKAAHDAGKVCFLNLDGLMLPLLNLSDTEAVFVREVNDTTDFKVTVTSADGKDLTLVDKNTPIYVAQTLTDDQKTQARTNIGALSTGDVDAVLQQAKDSGQFDGEDGYTPVKGKDYFDGYTPVKGKDYFDGANGKTAYAYAQDGGYTGTEAEFAKKLASESDSVFVADYDTTTFAEVKAAHNAGKVCFVKSDGMPFCQLLGIDDSEAIFIREINDTTDYKVTFTSAGVKDFTLVEKNTPIYVTQTLSDAQKAQARTNIGAAAAADIAKTASLGISNSAAVYVKISDFGSWGTGAWYQKGFAMLITSRAGEMVWVAISSDDSNTNAKAIRLLNTYSKIAAIYYSASESAVYVKANAWCNNINAHIISNINGDYVPTVAQASALPSDAVQITITEFGAGSGKTSIGDASRALGMTGSATRPTYNGADMALSSDISSGNANTSTMPLGFASRVAGATWGNTIGTSFTSWNDPTGGSIDFRQDNPSSGKMSIKVDGRVYINEGLNPVMGTEQVNGYWGMTSPDGENNAWIRTTTSGIIPYQEGGAGSGHCYLGTSGWYFGESYIDRMYSTNLTLAGRAYMNEWIQCNGDGGLFFPNYNGLHIMANTVSTYTPLRIVGERTTYNGVLFGNDSTGLNVMSNAEHQGLYNESLSRWITYYHRPTDKIGIGTAGLSGSTITLGGSTNVQGILTQGSPSEDTSVALMNRFQSDLFIQGSGAAPNGPTVAGFYLGKSTSDENRHMDIVSGGDYSYIDFNKAGRAADYDARLLVNVTNGYTEFMWGNSGEITQRVLNIQGSLRKNGAEVATRNDVVEAANGALRVNLSGNASSGYKIDKTFAEIQSAWNVGRKVYLYNGGSVFNLSYMQEDFMALFTSIILSNNSVTIQTAMIMASDSSVFSFETKTL